MTEQILIMSVFQYNFIIYYIQKQQQMTDSKSRQYRISSAEIAPTLFRHGNPGNACISPASHTAISFFVPNTDLAHKHDYIYQHHRAIIPNTYYTYMIHIM